MSTSARGAALILAMLLAALAATVAVALAAEQQRWLISVGDRRDTVQAQALALAGVQWARQILHDDARQGRLDHLGEPWALPLPRTPLENGAIEGSIEDAQARFNPNNLAQDSALARAERARIERLAASAGVAPAALEALADWIDADAVARPGGAEDSAYAGGNVTANAPLLRAAEAGLVRGIAPAQAAALAPAIAALPPGSALNVNTASPQVMALAFPTLSAAALATLLAERTAQPFTSVAQFQSRLPRDIAGVEASSLTVSSNYFLVSVRSRQGPAIAQARALLKREGGAWPTVVWQTLE